MVIEPTNLAAILTPDHSLTSPSILLLSAVLHLVFPALLSHSTRPNPSHISYWLTYSVDSQNWRDTQRKSAIHAAKADVMAASQSLLLAEHRRIGLPSTMLIHLFDVTPICMLQHLSCTVIYMISIVQ